MSRDEWNSIKVGDLIYVNVTGEIYRITRVRLINKVFSDRNNEIYSENIYPLSYHPVFYSTIPNNEITELLYNV